MSKLTNINPVGLEYHQNRPANPRYVDWAEKGLKITRLRLIGDRGVLDVSYCHGVMPDGEMVNVALPFDQVPYRGLNKAIIYYAKRDKVYAKGLGIFDNLSILH